LEEPAGSSREVSKEGGCGGEASPEPGELLKELDSLKSLLKEEQSRSERYLTQLKYLQADFDNYQKRVKREIEEAAKNGSARLIAKLLPILDDLERAVKTGGCSSDPQSFTAGVALILKGFKDVLAQEGLRPIEAVGKPFDPLLHEAVQKVECNDHGENTVVEEVRRGYMLGDKVIRPSIVKVAVKAARNRSGEGSVKEG